MPKKLERVGVLAMQNCMEKAEFSTGKLFALLAEVAYSYYDRDDGDQTSVLQ